MVTLVRLVKERNAFEAMPVTGKPLRTDGIMRIGPFVHKPENPVIVTDSALVVEVKMACTQGSAGRPAKVEFQPVAHGK
jgi:hypothetical protein